MLLHGVFAGTSGCCPSCGADVRRVHAFDGARLSDSYECYRCGPRAYSVRVSAG